VLGGCGRRHLSSSFFSKEIAQEVANHRRQGSDEGQNGKPHGVTQPVVTYMLKSVNLRIRYLVYIT